MNIPVKEISIAISVLIISILLPVFFAWWLFFPLSIIFIFYYDKPKAVLIAGFVLDLFYFSGGAGVRNYPLLTIFSLVLLVLSALFRDRFRF